MAAPLPTLEPAAIVGRLARERDAGAGPSCLAFDADGTLWSGDVGIDLFEAALEARAFRPAALGALEAEAEALGLGVRGDANEVARALYAAFLEERYEEAKAFAMMAWSFGGHAEAELAAFAGRVLDEAGLVGRVHAELAPILAWARAEAVPVRVVSASPRAVVVAGAARLGIRAAEVIAMTPAIEAGVVLPRLAGPVVYGEGKLEALAREPGAPMLLGAFGDSGYDAAMLRRARVAVAVHPKPSLVDVADTVPGLVEVRA